MGLIGLILSDDGARIFNIPQPAGFLVQRVADNSPAAKIGLIRGTYKANIAGQDLLLGGDIILGVGGIAVTPDGGSSLDILDYVNKTAPGEAVAIKLLRAGQVIELNAHIPPAQ